MKKLMRSYHIMAIMGVVVSLLGGVAYVTVAERKLLGIGQRRVGPNKTGIKGSLQAFADALKLIFKEIILPIGTYIKSFCMSSIISLFTSLIIYFVMVYAEGITLIDFHTGLFYILSVSSLGSYGILVGG